MFSDRKALSICQELRSPSLSLHLFTLGVYMLLLSACVCAVLCSRQVLWVMKDDEVEPRGCESVLLVRLLYVQPYISSPSVLFNPNLSHSRLKKKKMQPPGAF